MGRPIQFADIYHSASRYGHGDDLVPIILPRTQCWSFSRQRLLLGSELLRLQGQVPAEGAWGQTHYTDLAGNAFRVGIRVLKWWCNDDDMIIFILTMMKVISYKL